MSLILRENETCPYALKCPHHTNGAGNCQGTNPQRRRSFECYLYEDGRFIEGYRSPLDETGKMKIILD